MVAFLNKQGERDWINKMKIKGETEKNRMNGKRYGEKYRKRER